MFYLYLKKKCNLDHLIFQLKHMFCAENKLTRQQPCLYKTRAYFELDFGHIKFVACFQWSLMDQSRDFEEVFF